MSYIEGRLKKAEQAAKRLHPDEEDQWMIFFRPDPYHPDVPSEDEEKWREEHPDFKGKIYIYTFGTENLGPIE